jgi:hypothetical protein
MLKVSFIVVESGTYWTGSVQPDIELFHVKDLPFSKSLKLDIDKSGTYPKIMSYYPLAYVWVDDRKADLKPEMDKEAKEKEILKHIHLHDYKVACPSVIIAGSVLAEELTHE